MEKGDAFSVFGCWLADVESWHSAPMVVPHCSPSPINKLGFRETAFYRLMSLLMSLAAPFIHWFKLVKISLSPFGDYRALLTSSTSWNTPSGPGNFGALVASRIWSHRCRLTIVTSAVMFCEVGSGLWFVISGNLGHVEWNDYIPLKPRNCLDVRGSCPSPAGNSQVGSLKG
jgi:hypothetical protein